MGFLISIDSKSDNYDSILAIIDRLTKMVYYKSVKITIDALGLIHVIVYYYGVSKLIVMDQKVQWRRNSKYLSIETKQLDKTIANS